MIFITFKEILISTFKHAVQNLFPVSGNPITSWSFLGKKKKSSPIQYNLNQLNTLSSYFSLCIILANLQSESLNVNKNIAAFTFLSCLFLGPGMGKWAEVVLLN